VRRTRTIPRRADLDSLYGATTKPACVNCLPRAFALLASPIRVFDNNPGECCAEPYLARPSSAARFSAQLAESGDGQQQPTEAGLAGARERRLRSVSGGAYATKSQQCAPRHSHGLSSQVCPRAYRAVAEITGAEAPR
jgi:hypothetical protein